MSVARLKIPFEERVELQLSVASEVRWVGRDGDDAVLLGLDDGTLRFGRAEPPDRPAVARRAVSREPPADAPADAIAQELGLLTMAQLFWSNIQAGAPEFAFTFMDPATAGDAGYEVDVGVHLVTDRNHDIIIYTTPLHPGIQLAMPGPMGEGEYAGTTRREFLYGSPFES